MSKDFISSSADYILRKRRAAQRRLFIRVSTILPLRLARSLLHLYHAPCVFALLRVAASQFLSSLLRAFVMTVSDVDGHSHAHAESGWSVRQVFRLWHFRSMDGSKPDIGCSANVLGAASYSHLHRRRASYVRGRSENMQRFVYLRRLMNFSLTRPGLPVVETPSKVRACLVGVYTAEIY